MSPVFPDGALKMSCCTLDVYGRVVPASVGSSGSLPDDCWLPTLVVMGTGLEGVDATVMMPSAQMPGRGRVCGSDGIRCYLLLEQAHLTWVSGLRRQVEQVGCAGLVGQRGRLGRGGCGWRRRRRCGGDASPGC